MLHLQTHRYTHVKIIKFVIKRNFKDRKLLQKIELDYKYMEYTDMYTRKLNHIEKEQNCKDEILFYVI